MDLCGPELVGSIALGSVVLRPTPVVVGAVVAGRCFAVDCAHRLASAVRRLAALPARALWTTVAISQRRRQLDDAGCGAGPVDRGSHPRACFGLRHRAGVPQWP